MYNPAQGLPGKRIKLSEQTQGSSSKVKAVDSLGITVDTNLASHPQKAPQQIFLGRGNETAPYGFSLPKSSINAGKRRNPPPQPLKLQGIPSGNSSRPELCLRPSPQGLRTPMIIVTPTEDDTTLLPTRLASEALRKPRVASSIYTDAPSRSLPTLQPAQYDNGKTLLGGGETAQGHEVSYRDSTSSTVLPTPNRATGWWNVITSPFAAQFPGGSHSASSTTSNPTEYTPLCEDAAPVAYGGIRGLDEGPDAGNSITGGLHSSAFRNYIIPLGGEASKYYNTNNDFDTPILLPAEFSTPAVPQSARSARSGSDLLSPDDHELPFLQAGRTPPVLESSRRIPELQMPSQTPPKSSCAAVIENFAGQPTPVIGCRALDVTSPQEDMLSPKSPSPTVEIATVGIVQTARSINAERSRTPVPASGFSHGNQNPQPAFRIVANNDAAGKENNNAYNSLGNKSNPKVRDVYDPGPSPAFRLVTEDEAASHIGPSVSWKDNELEQQSVLFPNKNQSSRPAPRHYDNQSQRTLTYPLISKKERSYATEKNYQKPNARTAKTRRRATRKTEKWCLIGMSVILLIIILLAVILCMTVVHDHSDVPVESHWLNLTGFPPLPTGISTVVQPKSLGDVSACVEPREMWTCALPRGQQKATDSSRPDFRFSILFNNQTISNRALTQPVANRRTSSATSPAAYAHSFVRRAILRTRDALSSVMFTPLPAPPSLQDQVFLGKTTDSNHYPYDGEVTPFVISILSTAVPEDPKVSKRSTDVNSNSRSLVSDIPPAAVSSDGTAAMAELYPLPEAQPLRLFNRGRVTEHYGFYTYFDKSIFLYSPAVNKSDTESAGVNDNGGAPIHDADVRCTWSQTRFLTQIWTNTGGSLLEPSRSTDQTNVHLLQGPNGTVSAFDFSRPGSFPWPVTISIDRHGGDPTEKGLYCYGVARNGNIVKGEKSMHDENRAYGGKLVNPAPGPFAGVVLSPTDDDGGVDGGAGGCSCQWANWQ